MNAQRWFGRGTHRNFAVTAVLGFAGAAQAANYLDGQNREWLDMTLVTGSSWNTIDSVCQNASESAGPCAGTAGGYELTGWTWASRAEAVGLIQSFKLAAGDNTDETAMLSQRGYETQTYGWAAALVGAMGRTGTLNDLRTIGFMNGLDESGGSTFGQLAFVCSGPACGHVSYALAGLSASLPPAQADASYSGWFYRATAPVPEPSAILMMLAGLAGLATWRRRAGARTEPGFEVP